MRKISDILKQARVEKDLTLEEVERATKIKKVYLRAIESGSFHDLPSESYALGFVKNYAKYLDIPVGQALPLFRREFSAKKSGDHIIPEFRRTQHKIGKNLIFNTKILFILGLVVVVAAYIFFQYSSLLLPPDIEITSPANGSEVSGNVVEVTGKTDPYATVTVDGEEVFVNLKGEFRRSIYSFSGNTTIEVVAKNRYGKESRETVSVKVK